MSNTGKLLTGFLSGVNDALKYKIETDRKHKEDEYNYNTQRNRDINAFKEANELGLYKTDRSNRPDVERANAYLKALGAGGISYEPTPKEFQSDAADVALKKHNDLVRLGVPSDEARAIAYGYKSDVPKDTRTTNQKDFEYYNRLSPEQKALWDSRYGKSAAVKGDGSSPSVMDFKDIRDALNKAYSRHREISSEYSAAMGDAEIANYVKLMELAENTEDENLLRELEVLRTKMPPQKMAKLNRLLSELAENESVINRLGSTLPEYDGYQFIRGSKGKLGGWNTRNEIEAVTSGPKAAAKARLAVLRGDPVGGINNYVAPVSNFPLPLEDKMINPSTATSTPMLQLDMSYGINPFSSGFIGNYDYPTAAGTAKIR